MPQIYDMGPTALLPLRRKACWGFFRPKNPTASAGFEPANLGTKIQHATPRPPNPRTRSRENKNPSHGQKSNPCSAVALPATQLLYRLIYSAHPV